MLALPFVHMLSLAQDIYGVVMLKRFIAVRVVIVVLDLLSRCAQIPLLCATHSSNAALSG